MLMQRPAEDVTHDGDSDENNQHLHILVRIPALHIGRGLN